MLRRWTSHLHCFVVGISWKELQGCGTRLCCIQALFTHLKWCCCDVLMFSVTICGFLLEEQLKEQESMPFASAWPNRVIRQHRRALQERGTDIWDGIVERESWLLGIQSLWHYKVNKTSGTKESIRTAHHFLWKITLWCAELCCCRAPGWPCIVPDLGTVSGTRLEKWSVVDFLILCHLAARKRSFVLYFVYTLVPFLFLSEALSQVLPNSLP